MSGTEPTCPKFQPNIFDPSRCHDCLRQRHLGVTLIERQTEHVSERTQGTNTVQLNLYCRRRAQTDTCRIVLYVSGCVTSLNLFTKIAVTCLRVWSFC
uniref:Uncharacterized protein n=1 Tax=Anabas testudineus TaxID=64144 RepID=A0A3Q1I8K8_ANATE